MEQLKRLSVEQFLELKTLEEEVAYMKTLSPEENKAFGIAVHKEIGRRTGEAMVASLKEGALQNQVKTSRQIE